MSVEASSWAWKMKPGNKHCMGHKLVLLALADHADSQGVCWPSKRLIAKKTGLSESAVTKILKILERDNYITKNARFDGGRQTSNLFQLNLNRREGVDVGTLPLPIQAPQGGHTGTPGEVIQAPHESSVEPSSNHQPTTEGGGKVLPIKIQKTKTFAQRFVDWFGEAYLATHHKPYGASRADYIQAGEVLKAFSTSDADFETLKRLVHAAWNDTKEDPKTHFCVARVAMTVRGFCSVVNRVTLEKPRAMTAFEREKLEKGVQQ